MNEGQSGSTKPAAVARRGFVSRLFAPVDIASIVFFRIQFAAAMLWYVYRSKDLIEPYYIGPRFFFTYPGFEWVRPWPGDGMYYHFCAMAFFAAAILCGMFYRIAVAGFCLSFAYVFLLDSTYYNNHYYLIILVSFILVFVSAHRSFSFDVLLRPQLRSDSVPAWMLWLLRAQMGIPYFYGGIAKLSHDWLHGFPMRQMLLKNMDMPVLGRYFDQWWMTWLFTYGGLLLDVLIVPLLLWRRTRVVAFIAGLVFHLLNSQMFNIGIFPWLMITSTTIFFSPDWPRRLLRLPLGVVPTKSYPAQLTLLRKAAILLFAAYLAVQILVPLRHLAYPGNNPLWTYKGGYFSWHMKLSSTSSRAWLYASEPKTGLMRQVEERMLRYYLNPVQIHKMPLNPYRVQQFAQFLEKRQRIHRRLEVRAYVLVSLNGRKAQFSIDPEVNLSAVKRERGLASWILPLTEPLRAEQWNVPKSEWFYLFRIGERAEQAHRRRQMQPNSSPLNLPDQGLDR